MPWKKSENWIDDRFKDLNICSFKMANILFVMSLISNDSVFAKDKAWIPFYIDFLSVGCMS